MSRKKILLATLDRTFSNAIRERDNWTCQYENCEHCGNRSFEHDPGGLHNSHFQKRRKRGTRWLPDNCDAFCQRRHTDMEADINFYTSWKREQLGSQNLDDLILRANGTTKYTMKDRIEMNDHYRAQIKKMQRQRMDGVTGVLVLTPWD